VDAEGVRDLHQRPHRGIPAPEFQICQIRSLHRRALSKLLLGPASLIAERLDARGQLLQKSGFPKILPPIFKGVSGVSLCD
jgi:hypothetical protein